MNPKRTVIVTGGSGFIGSNLVRCLLRNGYSVVNLDLLTYAANPLSLADLNDSRDYVFVRGNIGDSALVRSLFEQHCPVGLFNLAAESHVDRSIVKPDDFVKTNVMGTFSLLEEARRYVALRSAEEKGKFRFLHVSTDEVFGSLDTQGLFTESTPYAPNSPYSASKASSDHFVRAYHHTYGLPTITTNCSNNYGPYQYPEKLIPLMILNALNGKLLPVYGSGSNVRDWIYVEDHCRALLLAFEKGTPGEVFAIGARNERKNIDLVQTICEILDEIAPVAENQALHGQGIRQYSELIHFVTDRPGHDLRYAIDPAKAQRELGWKPQEDFDSGMRKTILWYIQNPKWVQQVSGDSFRSWFELNYSWRSSKEER